MNNDIVKQVHKRAIEIFNAGVSENPLVQEKGKVENPIPINDWEGNIVAWFIGITISDILAGFIQLDASFNFMRYSTFQRNILSLDGCPKAKSWMDLDYINELAMTKASPEDTLSEPFLSYDKNISRIVWIVKSIRKDGRAVRIFVAGDFVYLSENP